MPEVTRKLILVEVTEEEETRLRECYTPIYELPTAEELGRAVFAAPRRKKPNMHTNCCSCEDCGKRIGQAILAEIRRKP